MRVINNIPPLALLCICRGACAKAEIMLIEIALPAGTARTADYPRPIPANLVGDIKITDLTLSRREELDKRTQPSKACEHNKCQSTLKIGLDSYMLCSKLKFSEGDDLWLFPRP